MIDLHLHTTASDGRFSPGDLVATAVAAGVSTLAVTDHDTLGGLDEADAAARAAGVAFVRGIEITAVEEGRDVHILGYFVDSPDAHFLEFLAEQRADRRRRATEMIGLLSDAGAPIDASRVFGGHGPPSVARDEAAVGRPAIARALVEAGHARDVNDAFERFLAEGGPAYVARRGASCDIVVRTLARIGAVASLAHPVKVRRDDLPTRLAQVGMAAMEVFHPDHDARATARFATLAAELRLVPTGGSDYHGPDTDRAAALGRVGPSPEDFRRLETLRGSRDGRR